MEGAQLEWMWEMTLVLICCRRDTVQSVSGDVEFSRCVNGDYEKYDTKVPFSLLYDNGDCVLIK